MENATTEKKQHGGARKGSGLKKGTKLKKTVERELVLEAARKRIFDMTDKLLSAQAIVAVGTHKMLRLYKDKATGLIQTETIRDMDKMQDLIDTGVYGEDYVIVTGRDPDPKAANMLLDRGLGKAVETIDLGNKDGQPFIVKLD